MRLLTIDARVTGRDRAALARLIESAEADIACVHRAPHLLRWRSISAALGRRSGLVVVGGGRPAGANLLMSTLGVDALDARDVPLGHSAAQPAGAALALLRTGGAGGPRFVLAGLRLAGNPAHRIEQAHSAQRALARFVPDRPPVLLAVDGVESVASVAKEPGADGAADVLRLGRGELGSGLFIDENVVAGEPAPVAVPTGLPAGVPAPTVVELSVG
ncbi:hypothetical protein [uncultured Jatrophihabitans sp.]|uniref:hypothetical protein n=1 Tax=uncultured Jatrophihabitans sp. TaxID=1610747 RepID=UPI0035CBA734